MISGPTALLASKVEIISKISCSLTINYIEVSFYILRLIYTGIQYKPSKYMCLCRRESDEKNKPMLTRRPNVFPI
jgi:hypothetical protein